MPEARISYCAKVCKDTVADQVRDRPIMPFFFCQGDRGELTMQLLVVAYFPKLGNDLFVISFLSDIYIYVG